MRRMGFQFRTANSRIEDEIGIVFVNVVAALFGNHMCAREAEVRRITIGGKPYEVPVVTCPEPMDCTPLESSRKPPAVLHERRSE